jgi:hypothetical protein
MDMGDEVTQNEVRPRTRPARLRVIKASILGSVVRVQSPDHHEDFGGDACRFAAKQAPIAGDPEADGAKKVVRALISILCGWR